MNNPELPRDPADVHDLMDNLTFEPPPTRGDEDALLASLPPAGSDVMVVRSLRLPIEVDDAIASAAKDAGVPKSTWIRQAIETALAIQGDDQPISRADAMRALTLLRSVRGAA